MSESPQQEAESAAPPPGAGIPAIADRGRPLESAPMSGARGVAFAVLILSLAVTGFAWKFTHAGTPFLAAGGIGSDITERVRRDESLLESEARFRNAFDSAAIGMAIVSLDGRWQQVNPPLCHMLGYTEAELLGLSFQGITHPDDLEADLGYVQQVLRGEIRSYQMEKRYFHRDGHVVWGLLSVSLVRAMDGAPLHFVSQIEDITARKQTEFELAANRRFLVELIDAIPLPLTVKDDDRRFVIVNEATGSFHQRPAAEFLGRRDSDFYPPGRVEMIRAEDDAVIGTGTPFESEQSFETVSGEQRWVIKYKRRVVSPNGRWRPREWKRGSSSNSCVQCGEVKP